MLTFRSASLITAILAAAIALLMFISLAFAWLFILLSASYMILLVIGSLKICSGFYVSAQCRLITAEKTIALTFDDGPDEATTPLILDILQSHGIMATFFVIGEKAERNPQILKAIQDQAHGIGIHSYSHGFFFDLYGRKKMEQDLLRCEQVIFEITGEKPVMFRPPYGVTNPTVARVVKRLGYKVIGWSVRSFDTKINDEEKLIERVIKGLHPGAIVLVHDDREITAKVLERIILMIKNEGYRFAGLDDIA